MNGYEFHIETVMEHGQLIWKKCNDISVRIGAYVTNLFSSTVGHVVRRTWSFIRNRRVFQKSAAEVEELALIVIEASPESSNASLIRLLLNDKFTLMHS